MRNRTYKTGLTLIEILVVAAIIVILITMVIVIATRIDTQGKERLTKNTIALLDAALGQFRDFGYEYSDPYYAELKFPPDCNGCMGFQLEGELEKALGFGLGDISITNDSNDPNYSGCEALYFFLSRVPESKKTLDKIDKSLLTSKGFGGADKVIDVKNKKYPLLRVIDPWSTTLRYSYYRNNCENIPSSEPPSGSPMAFPVITSAGADKQFGTADDIKR